MKEKKEMCNMECNCGCKCRKNTIITFGIGLLSGVLITSLIFCLCHKMSRPQMNNNFNQFGGRTHQVIPGNNGKYRKRQDMTDANNDNQITEDSNDNAQKSN